MSNYGDTKNPDNQFTKNKGGHIPLFFYYLCSAINSASSMDK